MHDNSAVVGVLTMAADAAAAYECAGYLNECGILCEVHSSSAHRAPNLGQRWLLGAQDRGVEAIVAVVGSHAHLVDVASAMSALPVVAYCIDGRLGKGVLVRNDVPVCSSLQDLVSTVAELVG